MADINSVRTDVAAFAAAVTAAGPLEKANRILLSVLRSQGAALISELQGAMTPAGAVLDAGDPVGAPSGFAAALLGIEAATDNQTALADLRGLVGRAVFNLNQVS